MVHKSQEALNIIEDKVDEHIISMEVTDLKTRARCTRGGCED